MVWDKRLIRESPHTALPPAFSSAASIEKNLKIISRKSNLNTVIVFVFFCISLCLFFCWLVKQRSRVVEMKFWSWLMLSSSPSWHQETKLNSAKSISHQNLFHISASLIPLVGGNFWRCQFWHTSFTLQQQFFEKQYKNLTTTKNTKNTIQGDFFN